jgi:hypothetical protein
MGLRPLVFAIALTFSLTSVAESGVQTVWRVGVFDGSSGEFADGEPHQAVNFTAGKDQPLTNWYAFAPVALAGKAADRATAPRAPSSFRLQASLDTPIV